VIKKLVTVVAVTSIMIWGPAPTPASASPADTAWEVSSTEIVFASQLTHTISEAQKVTYTNVSGSAIHLGEEAVENRIEVGGFFEIENRAACQNRILQAGESCELSVRFYPRSVGQHAGLLQLVPERPGARSPQVVLQGVSIQNGWLEAPQSVAFGSIPVSGVAEKSVPFTNGGSAPLIISEVRLSGPSFELRADTCSGATLQPGAGCLATIRFSATTPGYHGAALSVDYTNPVDSNSGVTLSGFGRAPNWTFRGEDIDSIAFGGFEGADYQRTGTGFELVSEPLAGKESFEPVTFQSLDLTGPSAGDFRVTGDCLDRSPLGLYETCLVGITLDMGAASGFKEATLHIKSTSYTGTRSIRLYGQWTRFEPKPSRVKVRMKKMPRRHVLARVRWKPGAVSVPSSVTISGTRRNGRSITRRESVWPSERRWQINLRLKPRSAVRVCVRHETDYSPQVCTEARVPSLR
jgi:hypothetical protein